MYIYIYTHTDAQTLIWLCYYYILRFTQICIHVRKLSASAHTYTRLYIYIYIYSHLQTDLFRSIRTHQCGLTYYLPIAGIETWLTQMPIKDSTRQPRGTSSSEVNFKCLWTTITIVYNGYREINSYMKSLAINANGNAITSFARELNPTGVRGVYIYIYIVYIYIYIYIYTYIYKYTTHQYIHTHRYVTKLMHMYINIFSASTPI